jgi:lipopolysaccharide/colanic/teichoic acid biosynthesis glycosyltransferase
MYLVCKRLFDISLAGLTVLVISPILICVMIALRLTGEGEIFYVQER